jgi:hypothetical protein
MISEFVRVSVCANAVDPKINANTNDKVILESIRVFLIEIELSIF